MLLKKIITKKFFLTNKGLYIYTIIKNKNIMRTTIAMQDLLYTSEPTNILAIGRKNENHINFEVKSITRYESSQGAKMVKYVCLCETINQKNDTFYVSYGLQGDKTNINLHPHIAGTDFNN